jgi:hypothetical protein
MAVESKKLKIGNLITVNTGDEHCIGVVTEVCYHDEIFKILSDNSGLKIFCTVIVENDNVTVLADVDDMTKP